MVNKKAPLSKEAKEAIHDDLKDVPEIPQGFVDKKAFDFVPKNIFSDAQVKEIAEGLQKGMVYVFARNVSRNTQYNVRKKLHTDYPTLKFDVVIARGKGQNALFPL